MAVRAASTGEFDMKDLDELKHFLGVRIEEPDSGFPSTEVATSVRYSKPQSMPLPPPAHLAKATEAGHENVDLTLYQGIVGSIMYGMLCILPDLASPIQQLL